MPSLIAYRKVVDSVTTYALRLPEAAAGAQAAQEIATLPDGRTVVVIFDGYVLPAEQPAQIAASVETLASPLDAALRDQIVAASPHVALIARRVNEKIRAAYTLDDELYLARIGVGKSLGLYTPTADEQTQLSNFGTFVEGVRQWGRDERAKLGL